VLLSPERGLRLSATAAGIVELCDGTRDVGEIIEVLAARHGAPRDRVTHDVRGFLADLRRRALLEGFDDDLPPPAAEPNPTPAPPPSVLEAPYTLVAELTHRCPLACPYCSNPKALTSGAHEMATEEWLRILDEAADMGVMQVHLSGGEPLARKDLEVLAARARALELYVNLVTSGMPADRARLEALAPSLDHVQLSVQDADPASSDQIAGLESHAAKMRFASWVKELGLPLTLNVVLHRANLDRVDAVVAMAERMGADRLELANVQLVSWALENVASLLPTRAQLDRARAVAHEARERLNGKMEVVLVLPDWHADRPRACMDGWGRRFAVVAPDGALLPCHAARTLPLAFESVRSASLRHVWERGEGLQAFRGHGWMTEPCASCDRRDVDHGGCRCQAFALTGDTRATDPACGLAPAHSLVVQARARAEGADRVRTWVYRGR
jgi:pyrroloquinoline quinone biosynthesis protein E